MRVELFSTIIKMDYSRIICLLKTKSPITALTEAVKSRNFDLVHDDVSKLREEVFELGKSQEELNK